MMVDGRVGVVGVEERRRVALTSGIEMALPCWILRRVSSVEVGMPASVRRVVSLLGVRARAMAG